MPAPVRKRVARVQRQTGGASGGHPDLARLGHALGVGASMDGATRAVIHAIAHHRPAVIGPGFDQVQLVAALGAVLGQPQVAGGCVDDHALGVAVAVAPDIVEGFILSNKGVVGRDAAILPQAHYHAVMIGEQLGRVCLKIARGPHLAVADGDKDMALAVENNARAVVTATAGFGLKDFLHSVQSAVLVAPANDGGGGLVAGQRLGVGQVEHSIICEIRVRNHIQQSALALVEHLRHTCHRLG